MIDKWKFEIWIEHHRWRSSRCNSTVKMPLLYKNRKKEHQLVKKTINGYNWMHHHVYARWMSLFSSMKI